MSVVKNAKMFSDLMEIVKRSGAYEPVLIDTIISQMQSGGINLSFSNIISAANFSGTAIDLRRDRMEINPIRFYKILFRGKLRSWINAFKSYTVDDDIEMEDSERERKTDYNQGLDSYIAYIFSPLIAGCMYTGLKMFGKHNGEYFIQMPETRAFYKGVFERSLYEITGLETLTNEVSKSYVAEYIPIVYQNIMIPYDNKVTTGLDRYELMNNRITGKIEIGPAFLTKEMSKDDRTRFTIAVSNIHNRTYNRLYEMGFDRESIRAFNIWAGLFSKDIITIFNRSSRAVRNILENINRNFYINVQDNNGNTHPLHIAPGRLRLDTNLERMGTNQNYRDTTINDNTPIDIQTGEEVVYGQDRFYTLALPALLEGYSNIYNSVDNIYNERNASANTDRFQNLRVPVQVWREMMTLSEPLAQMSYALSFDEGNSQTNPYDMTAEQGEDYASGKDIFKPQIRQYPQWQKLAARGLSYLKG